MNKTYLCHHGIKGQKWGIRRFQNEDGSLTKEGEERYGVSSKDFETYTRLRKEHIEKWDGPDSMETRKNGFAEQDKKVKKSVNDVNKELKKHGYYLDYEGNSFDDNRNGGINLKSPVLKDVKTGNRVKYNADDVFDEYDLVDFIEKKTGTRVVDKNLQRSIFDMGDEFSKLDSILEDHHYGRDFADDGISKIMSKDKITKIEGALNDLHNLKIKELTDPKIIRKNNATQAGQIALTALISVPILALAGYLYTRN